MDSLLFSKGYNPPISSRPSLSNAKLPKYPSFSSSRPVNTPEIPDNQRKHYINLRTNTAGSLTASTCASRAEGRGSRTHRVLRERSLGTDTTDPSPIDNSMRRTPDVRSFSRQTFRNSEQTPSESGFPIRLVRMKSSNSISPFNICDEKEMRQGSNTGRSVIKKIPETWRMAQEKPEKVGDCEESMNKIQALMRKCKKLNKEVSRVEKKANKTGNVYKKQLRSIRRGYRKQNSDVADFWRTNEDFLEMRAKMNQEVSEFKERASVEREEHVKKKRAEAVVRNITDGDGEVDGEVEDLGYDEVKRTILKVPNLAFQKVKTLTRAAMIESRTQSSPKIGAADAIVERSNLNNSPKVNGAVIVPMKGNFTERADTVIVPAKGSMTERSSTASPRKRLETVEGARESEGNVKRRVKVKKIEGEGSTMITESVNKDGKGGGMDKLIGIMKAKKKILEKVKMTREQQRKIEEEKVKDVVNIYSLKMRSKSTEKMLDEEEIKEKMKEDYLKRQQDKLGYVFEGGFLQKLLMKHEKSVGPIIRRLNSDRSLKL